jgi:hypothetical protein
MQFQYSETQSAIGTSNITDTMCEHGIKILNSNRHILTPNNFYEIFGPVDHEPDPDNGYTEPEWYFKGPGDTVLGIGWRYGAIRIRGSHNVHKQFITGSEICKTFLTELVEHFNNFMLIKE